MIPIGQELPSASASGRTYNTSAWESEVEGRDPLVLHKRESTQLSTQQDPPPPTTNQQMKIEHSELDFILACEPLANLPPSTLGLELAYKRVTVI